MQETSPRVVILLDVDGVINMSLFLAHEKWPDTKRCFIESFFIHYSPTVVEHINKWSEVAEVRWLTTWSNNAATKLAPALGLNAFEVVPMNENDDFLNKVECAIRVAEDVGPDCLLIWIDDDIGKWKHAHERIIQKKFSDWQRVEEGIFNRPNTVLVAPADGLTAAHLKLVDRVLSEPELTRHQVLFEFDVKEEELINSMKRDEEDGFVI